MRSNQEMAVHIRDALEEGRRVLQEFVDDNANLEVLGKMARSLAEGFSAGNKVLSCGNGGSACDAIHFAEELTGRFRGDRPALPAISLTDAAHLTCVANDYGFEEVFARGVMAYGKPGDTLLAISTSGNSRNVVRAVEAARDREMKVLLLLGKSGGALRGKGDSELWIRSQNTERIQEMHMMALHILIENVERILFPANYPALS